MRNLAREHPVHYVVLLSLLSIVAFGTFHELGAHARQQTTPTATPMSGVLRHAAERQTFHEADADADVGPGEAEPCLAELP